MACRVLRFSRFVFSVSFFSALVSLSGGLFGALGQGSGSTNGPSPFHKSAREDGASPVSTGGLYRGGRNVVAGESAAGLRLRAYRQKMAMRAWRASTPSSTAPSTGPPKQ